MDSTHDTPLPPEPGHRASMEYYISSILAGGILPRRGRGARSSAGLDGRGLLGLGGRRPSLGDAGADGMPPNHAAQPMGRDEASPSTCSSPRAPSGRSSPPRCSVARPSPEAASGAARWAVPGQGALVRMLCRETRSPGPETAPSPRPARLPQWRQSCSLRAVHSRRTTVRVALPRRTVLPTGTGRTVYPPAVPPTWSVRPCPGMNEGTSADVSGAGDGLGT